MIQHDTTLDIQIPPEKVVLCMFGGPNTISTGVWMFRAMMEKILFIVKITIFPQIALAMGVLTSNRRGVSYQLWRGSRWVQLLGAIAGCHAGVPCWGAIAGCHCSVPLLGCHCWVPLLGAIAVCHAGVPLLGAIAGVPLLGAIARKN